MSVLQSVATRGWELPNLQDVQAKSDALEASGFATVHSPLLSKATKQAMAQQASFHLSVTDGNVMTKSDDCSKSQCYDQQQWNQI